MARNSEKAMTALARWRSVFVDKAHEKARRRPYLATECNDLQEAIRWRRDIIKEIAFKVGQIQNPGLGEFKLRDLNDEINKLFRENPIGKIESRSWAGRTIARTRPGCWNATAKRRRDVGATATSAPPGFCPEFGNCSRPIRLRRLGKLAATGERPSRGILDASDDEQEDRDASDPASSSIYRVESNPADDEILGGDSSMAGSAVESSAAGAAGGSYTDKMIASYRAHVPVPSQKEIEAALLERKKAILLNQYMTDDMIERARETEAMLGVQTDEAEQDEEEENDDEANK
uniref:Pre-mRNA-splicing factor ISY1 n=1 Tax=Macrostomum lignano TaxID=282301 RepID=A0A1I8GCA2_9PLAT